MLITGLSALNSRRLKDCKRRESPEEALPCTDLQNILDVPNALNPLHRRHWSRTCTDCS
jgi:hypothetical protein